MILTAIKQKMIVFLMLSAFLASVEASNPTVNAHKSNEERLDSIEVNLDLLEERVKSTLMSGGSKPVSFHGEARIKLQFHNAFEYPDFMDAHQSDPSNANNPYFSGDKHSMSSGYDDAMFRLGMIVKPGRNTILWGKLGFTQNFAGNKFQTEQYNGDKSDTGFTLVPQKHENHEWALNLYEDMCAGIYLRTVPASFLVKLGNINWIEASPLTIWKGQPRVFAWDYLPYEIEQPIARYYEYAMAKGKKAGRAAWHKKAFNGLNVETVSLPAGLNFNFLMGRYGNYDTFERTYIDFATELGYAAEYPGSVAEGGEGAGDIIETGIGDSYRRIYHMRLAKKHKDLIFGANANIFRTNEDVLFAHQSFHYFYNTIFDIHQEAANGNDPEWSTNASGTDAGKVFIKEPRNLSVDLNAKIGEKLSIHADVGMSWIDTTWIWATNEDSNITTYDTPIKIKTKEHVASTPVPAVFADIKFKSKVNINADIIYAGEGFYSPFSFISPMDAFWAFGANMTNAGTFAGKNENSPYVQNMAGALLSVEPTLKGYGHLRFKYGQHFQPKEARDLIYIPYRLNGMDLRSQILSSYSRWGIGTYNTTYKRGYKRRLGDESYDPGIGRNANGDHKGKEGGFEYEWKRAVEEGPEVGGIRADYLGVFEGFVPFESAEDAVLNYISRRADFSSSDPLDRYRVLKRNNLPYDLDSVFYIDEDGVTRSASTLFDEVAIGDSIVDDNAFVPVNRKFTANFEIDAAYDIGRLIGYKNDFFVSGHASLSGVSTKLHGLTIKPDQDETLLWGLYLRFEPAIAITKKFYLIGLVGLERWMSDKTWMNVNYSANHEDGQSIIPSDVYGKQLTLEDKMRPIIKKVALDYRDHAYGLGFDWDMLEKVSLHMRAKYMVHRDMEIEGRTNDYKTFLASLELKTFF